MAQTYTLEEVQKKSNEEVLAELQRQGISSLEDLVSQSMDRLRSTEEGPSPVPLRFIYCDWREGCWILYK